MESTSELAWFRGEIWRSLIRPRDFARGLAREHYGLAGVLVGLGAGIGLSVGVDLLVLASKGLAPGSYVARLGVDAGLLGVRLAVSTALVAWIASGAVRLMGRRGGTLDQLFTALTFATAPLLLVPVPALLVTVGATTATLAVAAAIVLVLLLRVVIGVALNIRGILPPLIAVVTFVVVIALGAFVLGDQISRMRFLAYAVAPPLVADFTAMPAAGTRYDMLGFDLTLPNGWKPASGGVPGEAARFESSTATLVVARARAAALDTADTYADVVAAPQKVGLKDAWQERGVTRINGVVVVDDRYGGTYEGRTVVWRQFTAVPGAQGLALVYRVVEPADRQAALDEAAAIAATWHISAAGR
ncbi:MAG TPA: hypothetical protein VFC31_01550 [Candidatus Limnocylindria bacterium]|nr:hypothetical protein [Candidatus Limnocylindria bacterium]